MDGWLFGDALNCRLGGVGELKWHLRGVWSSESKCSTSTFLCLSLCKFCVHVIFDIEFGILAEELNLSSCC